MKSNGNRVQAGRPPNRRLFLKQATGAAAGLSALAALGRQGLASEVRNHAAQSVTVETGDEAFWRMVKEQFAIKDGIVLLNAANLCPSPRVVTDRVYSLTRDTDGDVSFQNRAKFETLLEETRAKLAGFLGADPDEIAIVRNTSEGNNIIVGGLDLGRDDEVVILDQNHPTNNVAWDVRAERFRFGVKRVSINSPPASAEEILATFKRAVSPRTKAIAFSDVSNTTGARLPVRQICGFARERGIHSHVDGAQTFGALKLDLHDLGCDSYASSSHKWLMGPREVGVLYVRSERTADIWPGVIGVGWGNETRTAARGARKFETLGQRDDAAIAGLGTAVDFHNLIGPSRIEARIMELAALAKKGMSQIPRATLITSASPELSAGVCVARFEGLDHRKMFEVLYDRFGIAGAPAGGIRFSPHIYNTIGEVEKAVGALSEVAKIL